MSEWLAAQELAGRGLCLLAHREDVGGVEIDLLMADPAGVLVMAEVKSLGSRGWRETRLSLRQKQRLRQAALCLQGRTRKSVLVLLVIVSHDHRVEIFSDFLS